MQQFPGENRELSNDGGEPFDTVIVDTRGHGEAERLALAAPVLERWHRGGLAVALVCSRPGLRALPDPSRFEVVVDDGRDGTVTVDATARLLGEAGRRLDAAPARTLLVAHEPASIRAAEALGFRQIVAVAPGGDAAHLLDAGARSVISELRGLRFSRALPSALERLDEIAEWCAGRPLALFLDYDGTLTPIVAHPADAVLAPEMRRVIAALADRFPVAVISGRDRPDVAERVGLGTLYYAGSHGLDIAGPAVSHTAPGAEAAAVRLQGAVEEIRRNVGDLPGVVIEAKRFSVAVHYRQVAPEQAERVIDAALHAGRQWSLEVRPGKRVRELVPKLDWDKGRALEWLCETLGIDPAETRIVYIGDDETDEDAFRVLGESGLGLRPGPRVAASLADYRLADVSEVGRFLEWLASRA
ncbi:MAG TPA: trehalose-phosphatase [Pseudomonadales bacterium]